MTSMAQIETIDYKLSHYVSFPQKEIDNILEVDSLNEKIIFYKAIYLSVYGSYDFDYFKSSLINKIKTPFYNFMIEGLNSYNNFDYESAINSLKGAIEVDKNNKWANLFLAYSYIYWNKRFDALQYLERALEIDKEFLPAKVDLAFHYYTIDHDTSKAISILKEVLDKSESSSANYYMGYILVNEKKSQEAKKYFLASVKESPIRASYIFLGDIDEAENKFDSAETYYLKAMELDKSWELRILKRLGQLYLHQKNVEKAQATYEKVVLQEKNVENYSWLIYCAVTLKEYNRAGTLIKDTEKNVGENHKEIDLFKIIIPNNKGEKKETQKEINEFYKYHGLEDINWLKKELEPWGIYINK